MEIVYILLGLLVIILTVYIIYYNKFVRLRNNIEEASSGIDIALVKRFDLIESLVNTVKGYSEYEKSLFESITLARSSLTTDRNVADQQLDSVLSRVNVILENYPDLKASDQYLNLAKNLSNTEEHLSASRRLYNRSVTNFNDLLLSFPSNIIGSIHNYTKYDLFEADENSRSKPQIDL